MPFSPFTPFNLCPLTSICLLHFLKKRTNYIAENRKDKQGKTKGTEGRKESAVRKAHNKQLSSP